MRVQPADQLAAPPHVVVLLPCAVLQVPGCTWRGTERQMRVHSQQRAQHHIRLLQAANIRKHNMRASRSPPSRPPSAPST